MMSMDRRQNDILNAKEKSPNDLKFTRLLEAVTMTKLQWEKHGTATIRRSERKQYELKLMPSSLCNAGIKFLKEKKQKLHTPSSFWKGRETEMEQSLTTDTPCNYSNEELDFNEDRALPSGRLNSG